MTDTKTGIRELIERWTQAVRTGDLPGVLVDHAEDIVMYDVPPPYEGVRGIDAYREAFAADPQLGAAFGPHRPRPDTSVMISTTWRAHCAPGCVSSTAGVRTASTRS